jgi:hypothetical protein
MPGYHSATLLFTCSLLSIHIVGQSFDFSKLTGSLTNPMEIDPMKIRRLAVEKKSN